MVGTPEKNQGADAPQPRRRKRERHFGDVYRHDHESPTSEYWLTLSNTEIIDTWVKHIRGNGSRLAERTRDRYEDSVREFSEWVGDYVHLTQVKRDMIVRYMKYLEDDRVIRIPRGSDNWYKAPLAGSSRKNQLGPCPFEWCSRR